MKKIIGVLALSACALPCAAMADTLELEGFGSYIDSSSDASPSFEPSGGGGGLRAKVNIPFAGFFVDGEAQKNSLSDDTAGDADLTNTRAGVGVQFDSGPVSLLGKVNYVHYNLKPDSGTESNDDGFGVHVGADVGIGILGVYGNAGYIKLSHGKGPEATIGIRGTLLPIVGLFAEYRYTELKDAFGSSTDLKLNNYIVGVSISL